MSQLPSQNDRRLSTSSRISTTSDETPKKSLSRKNSLKSINNNDTNSKKTATVSRNNSTKRRSRLTSTSSYTSSSDSDNEIERRTFEKQKRRETKRTTNKEVPTQDKPRANVGGLINNKAGTRGSGRRNSRDGVVSPSKKTLSNSSQYVSPYQNNVRNTPSPSQGKLGNSKNSAVRQLPTVPFSSLQKSLSKENKKDAKDQTEKNKDVIQSPKEADSSLLQVETPERSGSKLSSVSSLASSISSPSSSASSSDENGEDNEKAKTKKASPSQDQSEDQLEFSNKDTIKKVRILHFLFIYILIL